MQGAAATPTKLIAALAKHGKSANLADVTVCAMHTEGLAEYTDPSLANTFRSVSFFMGGNVRKPIAEGRADCVPIFLHEIPKLFHQKIYRPDVAMITVCFANRCFFDLFLCVLITCPINLNDDCSVFRFEIDEFRCRRRINMDIARWEQALIVFEPLYNIPNASLVWIC